MECFARSEGRTAFDVAAAFYDDARPPYPDRVYEVLRERCGLARDRDVLEIGAGSGQATRHLLDAGAHVVAIEPSHPLADRLRGLDPAARSLRVVEAAFEDVELPTAGFDLAVAATSFHWLEPGRALATIAGALRPGGWVALWWNVFGDPDRPDPFHEATLPVLGRLTSGPSIGPGGTPFALDEGARLADLATNGFRNGACEMVRWTLSLDASQTRRLYATYSNITRLEPSERAGILDAIERIAAVEFGGRVQREMVTPIYTARRD